MLVYLRGTPTLRPENIVNIWNLLWLSRRLIICTEQTTIYRSTFPNTLTSKCAKNHEIMHQSIPAVPIPPGQPRGICSRCQSQGWGIRNFIAARGLGICVPRGDPRAFDTRVLERAMDEFIGKDEAFVEQWLVRQGLEKLADVFKGMFSQFQIFLHYL